MDLPPSIFPLSDTSPSRADGKSWRATREFQVEKYFNKCKISKLINLQKLFLFRPWSLISEESFWKSLSYFTQPAANIKIIYLLIYFYQSTINYKVEV